METREQLERALDESRVGSLLLMLALISACREIHGISMLLPLSSMSIAELRAFFLRKAQEEYRQMTTDQMRDFVQQHFDIRDLQP